MAYTAPRMSASLILTYAFAAALAAGLLLKFWLASRQVRHVAQHRDAVPAAFAGTITLAAHQKAADYTVAKSRFGILEMAWTSAVLLGWTLLGGLDAGTQVAVSSVQLLRDGQPVEPKPAARREPQEPGVGGASDAGQ